MKVPLSKHLAIAVSVLLTFTLSQGVQAHKAIVKKIQNQPTQGLLGHPLGTVVLIDAVALAPQDSKLEQRVQRLQIERVEGRLLPKPILMCFETFAFQTPPILKPGQHIRWRGYESGRYQGIPAESFRWMPAVTSQDFHFAAFFQFVAEAPPNK